MGNLWASGHCGVCVLVVRSVLVVVLYRLPVDKMEDDQGDFWMIRQTWERAPPKYVRNPYIYFCQANFGRFARILNTRMPQCIIRACAQSWRNMSAEMKAPYIEMYKDDQKRYTTTKAEWKNAYQGRPPKYRKRNKYASTWLTLTPPKRYRTAFIWFHARMRPEMQKRYPNWDGPEQVQEVGLLWRSMTDDEKKPYKDQAEEDMTRYMEEMRSYRQAVFRQTTDNQVRNLEMRLSHMRARVAASKEKKASIE